jgi:hypothetical protein
VGSDAAEDGAGERCGSKASSFPLEVSSWACPSCGGAEAVGAGVWVVGAAAWGGGAAGGAESGVGVMSSTHAGSAFERLKEEKPVL